MDTGSMYAKQFCRIPFPVCNMDNMSYRSLLGSSRFPSKTSILFSLKGQRLCGVAEAEEEQQMFPIFPADTLSFSGYKTVQDIGQ